MPVKGSAKKDVKKVELPGEKTKKEKVLSPEAKARRARNKIKSSEARAVRHDRGLPVTMPQITWGWATEAMVGRWPNTRKVRSVDTYLAQAKGGRQSDESLHITVIDSNPEAKPSKSKSRSFQKNGR